MKNKKFEMIICFIISIMMITSVVIGYIPAPEYLMELTCISNMTIGIIFLVTSIRLLRGEKKLPNLFYCSAAVTVMLVFFTCMFSLTGMYHMNFKGAFFFLHVINPLVVLMFYLFFVDEKRNGKRKTILITPIGVLLYAFGDYVIGKRNGHFMYGFFEVEDLTIGKAIMVGIVLYFVLIFLGFLFYQMNCLCRKKEIKRNEYEIIR